VKKNWLQGYTYSMLPFLKKKCFLDFYKHLNRLSEHREKQGKIYGKLLMLCSGIEMGLEVQGEASLSFALSRV
jgi:hypothetical protein